MVLMKCLMCKYVYRGAQTICFDHCRFWDVEDPEVPEDGSLCHHHSCTFVYCCYIGNKGFVNKHGFIYTAPSRCYSCLPATSTKPYDPRLHNWRPTKESWEASDRQCLQ